MTKAKKISPSATPPQKDYSYLRKLDTRGWYKELIRLHRLSVDHNLGLHSEDRYIIVKRSKGGADIFQLGGPYASFTVNLNMPDALLVAEFDRWLQEARAQIALPIKKRGPRSANTKFDRIIFFSWIDLKLVEFADLLAWRSMLSPADKVGFSDAALGLIIGRNSSKDVNTTRRVLKQALASLPSLFAQLEYESIQTQKSRDAIRARLTKQISR